MRSLLLAIAALSLIACGQSLEDGTYTVTSTVTSDTCNTDDPSTGDKSTSKVTVKNTGGDEYTATSTVEGQNFTLTGTESGGTITFKKTMSVPTGDTACPQSTINIVMDIDPDGDSFTGTSSSNIDTCGKGCAVKAKLSGSK